MPPRRRALAAPAEQLANSINRCLLNHALLQQGLTNTPGTTAAQRQAARDDLVIGTFQQIALHWDKFIDDWLVTAVAHDSSVLREKLTTAVQGSPAARQIAQLGGRVTVSLPHHLRHSAVRQYLDPNGLNVEFKSRFDLLKINDLAGSLHERAKQAGVLRGSTLHEATLAVRDSFGHASPASLTKVQASLRALAAAQPALGWRRAPGTRPSTTTVNRHLGARPPRHQTSRLELWAAALVELAGNFPSAGGTRPVSLAPAERASTVQVQGGQE